MAKISEWVNSDEGQGQLNKLGQNMGNILADGIKFAFSNDKKMAELMTAIGGAILRAVPLITETLYKAGGEIFAGILKGVSGGNISSGTASGIGNGLMGAINPLGSTVNSIQQISKGLGYADGGLVPGPLGAPQLAMVHGGEMILNQSQQQALGSATINIYDARDPSAVARAVDNVLKQRFGMARGGA
jgi:hypothetical protein